MKGKTKKIAKPAKTVKRPVGRPRKTIKKAVAPKRPVKGNSSKSTLAKARELFKQGLALIAKLK